MCKDIYKNIFQKYGISWNNIYKTPGTYWGVMIFDDGPVLEYIPNSQNKQV